MGLIRRVAGSVVSPRATLAELVQRPVWADTWLLVLVVFAAGAIWLLSTDVGQQALVDERVRVIETFGGTVNDTEYAALLAKPPWWAYFTSGGRLLLTPEVTLLVAFACWALARRDKASVRFTQALSIVVHASVVLALGQLVAAPLHYGRETLTSPLNLAAVLPLMEEGTLPARFFGTIDLFALWWMALLAIGLGALTGRSVKRYATALSMVYIGFAAVMAGVIAAVGGS
jgi:Yip1 domain